jgi:DNA repair exonuclease SbcCD ATPase subunit
LSSINHREQLRNTLQDLGLGARINRTALLQNVDLSLSTPCYQAFFKILESADTLHENWQSLQEEIARYKFDHKDLPRDLYLTFLLMDVVDANHLRIAQAISSDAMVCRKIVLYAAEASLVRVIESLPFIAVGSATAGSAPSVQQTFSAFHSSGYPAEILEAISERASVENILTRILEVPVPTQIPNVELEGVTLADATRLSVSRLKNLNIHDFRGIRQASIDLSANLTAIYGPNGTGKTSILDAIEWTLLDSVERLETETPDDMSGLSPYISLFSEKPQTTVSLDMEVMNRDVHISRVGGPSNETLLAVNDRENADDRQLLTAITGQEGAKLDLRVLRRLIRSTSFLSQSTLKDFLSNDPSQRYWSLSHLLGTQDYMRILDKLQELRTELDVRAVALQQEMDSSQRDVAQITDQIEARRSLLSQSSVLRDSEVALEALTLRTAESLRATKSPYTEFFRSVTGYEETQSSVSISTDWVDKKLKRERERAEELTTAKDALARNKEIAVALARTAEEHQHTSASIRGKEEEFNSKRTERDQKQSEINSLSGKIQKLTHQQTSLREAIVIVAQMGSLNPILKEQEEQARLTENALQESLKRKNPLTQETVSVTQSYKEVTERLTRLRAQLATLDELESSSTAYIQLLQERPFLQQELRFNRQKSIEQQATKTAAIAQLAGLREELRSNNMQREKHLRSVERFGALVLELQQYLTGPDCPLCGHSWDSAEQLLKAVNARTGWVSPQLRELERLGKELQRRIEVADAGLRSSEQDIASLTARQSDLETRLRATDENERSFRHRLERIGIETGEFTETALAVANLRVRNDSEIAATTKEIAALDTRLRQLRELSSEVDVDTLNLEEQCKRARSRLADSQRRFNDLARQFSELELAMAPDRAGLERELARSLAESGGLSTNRSSLQQDLQSLDAHLQRVSLELESLKRKDKEYTSNSQNLQGILDRTSAVLLRVQLSSQTSDQQVALVIEDTNARVAKLDKARTNLREMDQITSWLISRRQIEELTGQLNQLSAKAQGIARQSEKLKAWHSHLSGLYVAILDAKAKVETLQLAQYGPTMNLLYQRLNTHPLFREIRILIDPAAQSVKINVSLAPTSGAAQGVTGLPPALYLSEAQLNVVALTIFLSHSFQQRWSRFAPLLLDDPVMNLDDFNANGLIDCLRTFAENGRQFVISTCDIGFYRLLLLKLRCMNQDNRTRFRAYRLDGISSSGPSLIQDYPAPKDAPTVASTLLQ